MAAAAMTTVLVGLGLATPAAAQASCIGGPTDGESHEAWLARCEYGPIAGSAGERTCVMHAGTLGNRTETSVQCVHPSFGWWSNGKQCYLSPTPQPPPEDPYWARDDRDPESGIVYWAACPFTQGVDGYSWTDPYLQGPMFVELGDDPIGALIEEVIGTLDLSGPDIHMAPDPSGAGLVGLPVWMWTPETASTWNPEPLVLPLGDFPFTLRVTPTARVVLWEMGDGGSRECNTAGTPYHPSYGVAESPDCGYVYEASSRSQSTGEYTVTATTTWDIVWELEGTSLGATVTTERESSTTVVINELQVLN